MDAGQRLADLPPVARASLNWLDCLQFQDAAIDNRYNADGSES